MLSTYPVPSKVCDILLGPGGFEETTTTETIFGMTLTGEADFLTGTVPGTSTTISLSTATEPNGDSGYFNYAPEWLAIDMVDVLYLVYAPADTDTGAVTTASPNTAGSGNTSVASAARVGDSYVVILVTVGMAFTSCFLMLTL